MNIVSSCLTQDFVAYYRLGEEQAKVARDAFVRAYPLTPAYEDVFGADIAQF